MVCRSNEYRFCSTQADSAGLASCTPDTICYTKPQGPRYRVRGADAQSWWVAGWGLVMRHSARREATRNRRRGSSRRKEEVSGTCGLSYTSPSGSAYVHTQPSKIRIQFATVHMIHIATISLNRASLMRGTKLTLKSAK